MTLQHTARTGSLTHLLKYGPTTLIVCALIVCIASGCGGSERAGGGRARQPEGESAARKANAPASPAPATAAPPTTVPAAARTPPPTSERDRVQREVVGAIESRSYAALTPLMQPTVRFLIDSTGCCGPGPIAQESAVANLGRLNAASTPWNFDQGTPAIRDIKARNAESYGTAFMGVSANAQVAAFWLTADHRIEAIRLGNARELLPKAASVATHRAESRSSSRCGAAALTPARVRGAKSRFVPDSTCPDAGVSLPRADPRGGT